MRDRGVVAMPTMLISVAIPAYNEGKYLGRCLAALANQTYPADRFEVILVDNNSTDATAEIARRYRVRDGTGLERLLDVELGLSSDGFSMLLRSYDTRLATRSTDGLTSSTQASKMTENAQETGATKTSQPFFETHRTCVTSNLWTRLMEWGSMRVTAPY